jgi:hypothetical protein
MKADNHMKQEGSVYILKSTNFLKGGPENGKFQ